MPYTFVIADGQPYPGARRDPHWGVLTYTSRSGRASDALASRLPAPHTWAAYVQRRLNGEGTPDPTGTPVEPRANQVTPITDIVAASHDGAPGYALAYPTGSGKTLMSVAAANSAAPERVLVISTLSYAQGWRDAITAHSTSRTEWVVINPARLRDLFALTGEEGGLHDLPVEQRAAAIMDRGAPLAQFDWVITDEAQMLDSDDTDLIVLWRLLVGWRDDGRAPRAFTVSLSGTMFSNPAQTVAAAHLIAAAKHVPVPSAWVCRYEYRDWLRDRVGLLITQDSAGRWHWDDNVHDVLTLDRLLYECHLGASATREDLGMPLQTRTVHRLHLSASDRDLFARAWPDFASATDTPIRGGGDADPDSNLGQYTRTIQKLGVLKAPYVARLVCDYLADGYQVIVPAWMGTTVTALQKAINAAAREDSRLSAATMARAGTWSMAVTGDHTPKERDLKIRAFQSGLVPVIVTSVVESISLHAGQKGGGLKGADATPTPRVTVFGDLLTGGKRAYQAEGRGTRDQQVAPAVYTVAEGTDEVAYLAGVFRNLANTRSLTVNGQRLPTDTDIADFMRLADDLDPTPTTVH